jgi:hypothetical protein
MCKQNERKRKREMERGRINPTTRKRERPHEGSLTKKKKIE